MIKNILRRSIALLICYSIAFAPLLRAGQLALPSGDMVAPSVTQETYIDNIEPGQDYEITVTVKDDVGVQQVILYYRDVGSDVYKTQAMLPIDKTDDYTGKIIGDEISEPGIEYYIKATDQAGNTLLHGYSFSPLSVKTVGSDGIANTTSSSGLGELANNDSSIFSNKWFWIGVGVLVLGAAASGGGGGGGGAAAETATLSITTAEPGP